MAWWKRLPAPPSGYSQCFGLIEAEDGTSLDEFTTSSNAAFHGGGILTIADVSAATAPAKASFKISTAGITERSATIENVGPLSISSGVQSPIATISATAAETTGFASTATSGAGWCSDHAPSGHVRHAGEARDADVARSWSVRQVVARREYRLGPEADTAFGFDWLMLVPANQRAASPTGEALDDAYPRFMPAGTGASSKTIRSDLSGVLVDGGR